MIIKKCHLLLVTLLLLITPVIGFSSPVSANNFSTSFECASSVVSFSAVAPASVTQGSSFSITNISSTSTVPNGFTVNKIVSTDSATNATPASSTNTWTGAGTGTLTVTYPNQTMTATGSAGNQISINITSIVIYITGLSSPITCDVPGGLLTANGAGESLNLETIGITAAQSSGSTNNKTTTTTSSTTNNANNTSSTTTKGNTSSSTNQQSGSSTPTNPTATSTPTNKATVATVNSKVNEFSGVDVVIHDNRGKPVKGADVTIDSLTSGKTDSTGSVYFSDVQSGSHSVVVSYAGKTSTKNFNAVGSGYKVPITMNVGNQLLSSSHITFAGIGMLLMILIGAFYMFVFRKHSTPVVAQESVADNIPTDAPLEDNMSSSDVALVDTTADDSPLNSEEPQPSTTTSEEEVENNSNSLPDDASTQPSSEVESVTPTDDPIATTEQEVADNQSITPDPVLSQPSDPIIAQQQVDAEVQPSNQNPALQEQAPASMPAPSSSPTLTAEPNNISEQSH